MWNLIAAGFVDTPLSAAILGDELDARREELRTTLPIRRVVGPTDIAALAVHLMTNTAVTGATFDIDGGQQLVEGRALMGATLILLAASMQRHGVRRLDRGRDVADVDDTDPRVTGGGEEPAPATIDRRRTSISGPASPPRGRRVRRSPGAEEYLELTVQEVHWAFVPRAPAWLQRAIEEQVPRGAQNSPDAPAPPDDPPPPLGGLPPLR